MLPFRDDNPTSSFPYVTITLIIINVVVYVLQMMTVDDPSAFTGQLSVIPIRFTSDAPDVINEITHFALSPYLTMITYAFGHGGLLHLGFNMLFLWIFGDNIEDSFGRIRFIAFYIICAAFSALCHILMHFESQAFMMGASGAIAGILGAYLLLYPKAHIDTLFIFIIIIKVIKVPAVFFIGLWFFIQLMNVMASDGLAGGTAWHAHIGGFIAGIALTLIMHPKDKKKKRKLKIVYH